MLASHMVVSHWMRVTGLTTLAVLTAACAERPFASVRQPLAHTPLNVRYLSPAEVAAYETQRPQLRNHSPLPSLSQPSELRRKVGDLVLDDPLMSSTACFSTLGPACGQTDVNLGSSWLVYATTYITGGIPVALTMNSYAQIARGISIPTGAPLSCRSVLATNCPDAVSFLATCYTEFNAVSAETVHTALVNFTTYRERTNDADECDFGSGGGGGGGGGTPACGYYALIVEEWNGTSWNHVDTLYVWICT